MLGESAGRSAGNSPRAAARRRNTPDERAFRTHLKDDPEEWPENGPKRSNNSMRQYVNNIVIGMFAALVALGFEKLMGVGDEPFTIFKWIVFITFNTLIVGLFLLVFGDRTSRRP